MLKKIVIITSAIILNYSAQAAEIPGQNNPYKYCSGSPKLPTIEDQKNTFLTKTATILEYCFKWTPDRDQFEEQRQEAFAGIYQLADLLFPTFFQLSGNKLSEFMEERNTIISSLMEMNHIHTQRNYLMVALESLKSRNMNSPEIKSPQMVGTCTGAPRFLFGGTDQ